MERFRHLIIPGIGVLVVAGVLWYLFAPSRAVQYQTAQVTRGPIVQESLASGNVESPTTARLHFTTPGKLTTLVVHTGQRVVAGTVLARQDTSVLEAQLAQALSQVVAQKAQLQSLVDGTRPEQLAVTQSQVAADSVAVSRSQASEADALRSAFTVADAALQNAIDPIFSNPTSPNPKLIFFVNDSTLENTIESGRVSGGASVAAYGMSLSSLNTSDMSALETQATNVLSTLSTLLAQANQALAAATPGQQASQTQLTTWATNVSTARTSVNGALTTLSASITVRQSAEAVRAKDEKTLALQQAGATASALDAQRAAIAAAQSSADALHAQIRNLQMVAPFSGTVTDTQGTVGENVTPDVAVVSLIPKQALDVLVNISEDNIVGVKTGDPVRIELDAFPAGTSFPGVVADVDPAQTIDGGAIYYQSHIAFTGATDGVRPGMTANVWIVTASSSDAVLVPASAIARTATSSSVRILVGGVPQARAVTTGMQSQDGHVQILSGLSGGEEVVIGE